MSSNYTGNPVGVQAPAIAPAAGVAPVATLPADGDSLAASSVAQMVKVGMDYIAYLMTFLSGLLSVKQIYIDATGGAVVAAKASHIYVTGTAPSRAFGTGAGTGPACTVTGNDTTGFINLTTGTTPTAGATVLTITFAVAHLASVLSPVVVLMPATANTSALNGAQQVIATSSGATMVIVAGGTALAASTSYVWQYVVIGCN